LLYQNQRQQQSEPTSTVFADTSCGSGAAGHLSKGVEPGRRQGSWLPQRVRARAERSGRGGGERGGAAGDGAPTSWERPRESSVNLEPSLGDRRRTNKHHADHRGAWCRLSQSRGSQHDTQHKTLRCRRSLAVSSGVPAGTPRGRTAAGGGPSSLYRGSSRCAERDPRCRSRTARCRWRGLSRSVLVV